MRELYYRSHKYLALFGVPVVCYVVAISHRFVELWLGPNFRMIALPLSVLLVVNFFNLTTGPGFLIFAWRGNLGPGVQSSTLGIVLNVVLSLGLIYKFGFAGAVLGTTASLTLASGYFMAMFHRRTRYSISRVMREGYLKPMFCSVLILAALFAIHPAKNLVWCGLVGMVTAFAGLYSTAILLSRFFDEYDWNKVESLLPAARYVRRVSRIA